MHRYLLSLLIFLSGTLFADSPAPISPEKLELLRSGEVLYEYTRRQEPGGSVRLEIFIRADVEQLWDMLTGCGKAFIFVDGLEQCEILEKTSTRAVIHQVTDPGILVPVQDYTYESRFQAYERMDFSMVDGTMKAIDGSWEFFEAEEGVMVIYQIHVQTGLPVPRFLVRMSIRKNMVDMLACIRGLVDGSGTLASRDQDLERCPGEL